MGIHLNIDTAHIGYLMISSILHEGASHLEQAKLCNSWTAYVIGQTSESQTTTITIKAASLGLPRTSGGIQGTRLWRTSWPELPAGRSKGVTQSLGSSGSWASYCFALSHMCLWVQICPDVTHGMLLASRNCMVQTRLPHRFSSHLF